MNKNEIQYLDKLGFEIGSHSVKHTLLSRLSKRMQKVELLNSKLFLENLLKKRVFSFCYPYGGSDSYDRNTLKLLSDIGYLNAVTVDSKDIDLRSLKKDKFEIPRYDCNQISKMFFKKI